MSVIQDGGAYHSHSKKRDTQWTSGARYDPEAEDADQYLRKADNSEEESDHSEEEGIYIYEGVSFDYVDMRY